MIDFSVYEPLVEAQGLPDDLAGMSDADLESVCDEIRRWCGWHIAPAKVGDVLVVDVDRMSNRVLSVPSLHVTAVTAVTNAADEPIDDYEWRSIGQLWREQGWPHGYRQVKVTLSHGFATTPAAVKAVVVDMLRDLANAESGGGVSQVELDDATIVYANPYAPRGASTNVGVRRSIGEAYGHILGRFQV